MAQQIGSLNAKLTASDAGFSSTLKKARGQIGAFSAAVASGFGIGAGIGLITQAVSGIKSVVEGTISGITSAVERQMEVIDRAAKASDVLGATTESVLELAYAGELAGATFEDVTGAMAKMQKTIGEALSGSASARDALKAIGLDAEKLSRLSSPIEALGQIADELNKLPTKAQQASAAMDIFGKGAQSILPLLQGGSEGIRSAAAEAETLGLAVSRVDAQQVEQANDAVTKLKGFLSGLANTIAVEVAPYVTKLINDFVNWATEGGRAKKFVGDALTFIKAVAGVLYGQFVALRGAWNMFWGAVSVGASVILTAFRFVLEGANGVASAFGVSSKSIDVWVEKIKKAETNLRSGGADQFKSGFKDLFGDMFSLKSMRAMADWMAEAKKTALAAAQSFVANQKPQGLPPNQNAKEIASTIEKMQQDLAGVTTTPLQKIIDKLKELGATPIQIGKAVDLFNAKAVADIFAKLREDLAAVTGTQLERMVNKLKEAGASAKQIAEATDLFKQIDLRKFADNVKDALKTPADAFRETIEQLKDAVAAGLISPDQAKKFALSKLPQTASAPLAAPALIRANSAQAQLFQYNSGRKTVEDQQLVELRKMAKDLGAIKDNTKGGSPFMIYGGL